MPVSNNKPGVNELLAQAQNQLIENLRSSEKRYSDLVEHLRDVVFQLDVNFKWLYLNQAWVTMTGYSVEQTKRHTFTHHLHFDDALVCQSGLEQLIKGKVNEFTLQVRLITADDQEKILELSCRAFKNELGRHHGIAGILNDITERVKAEKKITHLAYHDALTGLANRRLLMKYIEDHIPCRSNQDKCTGLIFVDLDRFKQINDMHGHIIGDLLLCSIAYKLRTIFAGYNCLLARIGGDEFVICLELASFDENVARIELLDVCAQMLQKIREKEVLGVVPINVTASVGAILLDSSIMDKDDALKFADAAMYKSKRNGRNDIQFYDRHFEREALKQKLFEKEIQEAMLKDQFDLFYQPQIDINSGCISKVEALIRWRHPQKGIVYPDDFIPYLEISGLIIDVGSWVLEESFRQLAQWIEQGVNNICVSINVSALQFMRSDFVDNIAILLQKYAVPAHLIELELTENVAVSDIDLTITRMKMVNILGVKIALDDFGTGYSSLAYLKYFPINTLKIDKSFINGVPDDGYDAAIVETTMVMSRHLGLTVVAEGVENNAQLDFLKEQQCHLYQGYLCSEPMTGEDIFPLLSGEIEQV